MKWNLLNKPGMYIPYFVNLRKKVFSSISIVFLRYFGALRVNIGGFESFSSIWGMFMVQKHNLQFQTKSDVGNFRSIFFDLKTLIPVSNLTHQNSQFNQNDPHVPALYTIHE